MTFDTETIGGLREPVGDRRDSEWDISPGDSGVLALGGESQGKFGKNRTGQNTAPTCHSREQFTGMMIKDPGFNSCYTTGIS